MKKGGGVILCLIGSGVLFFVAGAQTSSENNAACLACHGLEASTPVKIHIDLPVYESSIHGRLACVDCHSAALVEDEDGLPHKKDLPDVDCTSRCHRDVSLQRPGLSPLYYPDSVHGKGYLERHVPDVAKCWDCHGKHNIAATSDPSSLVNRRNIPLTCSRCHEDMSVVVKYHIHFEAPYQEYMQSVHGKALTRKGLVSYAAVCTDCHGVHNIQGVGTVDLPARKPETCGRCHQLIFEEYSRSIHGREALKGNLDVPVCSDCHGEHKIISPRDKEAPTYATNIPETCASCHSKPEVMKKYGIPEKRIATFIESLHGIALGYGFKAAATCTSCHGIHGILPAADPLSSVHPANLGQTCGKPECHPGMPDHIKVEKIHRDYDVRETGAPYYVQRFLLWAIVATLAVTILWFLPGFIRKARRLKKR